MLFCFVSATEKAIPVTVIQLQDFSAWLATQNAVTKQWLTTTAFRAEAGNISLIPDAAGRLSRVLCCVLDKENLWSVGHLPFALPEGIYQFDDASDNETNYAIAFGLGAYQFTAYKQMPRQSARLVLRDEIKNQVLNQVEAIYLVRDLINTPTEDMGPTALAAAMAKLAAEHNGASFTEIVGDALLQQNYAAIHTVGRASAAAPRLLDLRWGDLSHRKVTLVGKGVCFDSGGLDIKSSSNMLLMKKDMAGAAHALGLARMIMQAKLPINLRVLIPAVENAISANAYRPGDVIKSRQGLTIEVGNTDAEGRVILADALTEAVSEHPALLIDLSTLTGAARIAVGTELSAVFSNHDGLVNEVIKHGNQVNDPIWRLPLFAPYREYIMSTIADINNNAAEPYAGAITAALFLKEFVPDTIPWLHFDMMAWNLKTRPGRPQGGEAMAVRALFDYLQTAFLK